MAVYDFISFIFDFVISWSSFEAAETSNVLEKRTFFTLLLNILPQSLHH